MKIFLIIFVFLSLLIVGLSLLPPSNIEGEQDTNVHYIKKVHHQDYLVPNKRRDFIRERREEQLAALKGLRNRNQKAIKSRHDDFISIQ